MKQLLPKVFYNPISLIGLVMVAFNAGFIIFLSVIELLSNHARPNADLVIWIILPGFVLITAEGHAVKYAGNSRA